MITLTLDWREVLWWMQGGMSGSHNCWGVYEDMVNKVWPQCSEQERRNLWYVMRRDLGFYWRPDGWRGRDKDFDSNGDGPRKKPIDYEDPEWSDKDCIFDITSWMYFRQVLARFDPENQYAVTIPVHNAEELDEVLRFTPAATIISRPAIPISRAWQSDTATVTIRAYKWQYPEGHDAYFINWSRRCDPDRITKVERIDIPDNRAM